MPLVAKPRLTFGQGRVGNAPLSAEDVKVYEAIHATNRKYRTNYTSIAEVTSRETPMAHRRFYLKQVDAD